ncbi:hypothetical protein PanWU01x14_243110 [Parasponia andersonii]|uniref:Uncharacterized protein n=1 Tax=Parasponia andersonii TaxID=3476 RepID=A0A2P5BFI9_PARAD|nr:hypothetical protein PanWU01x14_243110 [Parasponia andersonii]
MDEDDEPQSSARPICCFGFSSKKTNRERAEPKWEKKKDILSDMSTTFSVKEQERRLKRALEEEDKVAREAERLVQWVKQESARMDAAIIQKILDDEPIMATKN